MNKYRKKYIEENGMKTFNNYNVNDYTEFLENELEAITVTHCCKSDSELLPSFLYKSDGGLYFKHRENTDVTEQWKEYLKTR
tara:strand:- start:313 stop:558 length:246 start_codon:yes stop_codon:yes gene_type:complete